MALVEKMNNTVAAAPTLKPTARPATAHRSRTANTVTAVVGCLFMMAVAIGLWWANTLATMMLLHSLGVTGYDWAIILGQVGATCFEIAFAPRSFKDWDMGLFEFLTWVLVVVLDIGTSFASGLEYLQGRTIPVFAQLHLDGLLLILAATVWCLMAGFGPEPVFRRYMGRLLDAVGV